MRRSPHRARLVAALATAIALFAAAGASAQPARESRTPRAFERCRHRWPRSLRLRQLFGARPARHGADSPSFASPALLLQPVERRLCGNGTDVRRLVDRPTSVRAVFVGEDQHRHAHGRRARSASSSRPRGLDCGAGHDSCSADFPWGTKLRLVPVPAAVGRFARWGAACWNFGAGACTLAVRHGASRRPPQHSAT